MKVVKWILVNGSFAALLALGIGGDVAGARRTAIFFLWFVLLVTPFSFTADAQRKLRERGRPVPSWLSVGYDFGIVIYLVWNGWVICAAAALLQGLLIEAALARATAQPAAEGGRS